MPFPYLPQTESDLKTMLAVIGVKSVDELFSSIPDDLKFKGKFDLPAGQTEPELKKTFQALSDKNQSVGRLDSYLGAGAYEHFSPSLVKHLAGRSEFYTAYTPYQPEMTQGMLQAIYEYQSSICALTGMDVSNASLYEGGHAVAEASLMALATTRRNKVVLAAGVHPEYAQVLRTYTQNLETVVERAAQSSNGQTDFASLEKLVDDETAAIVLQQPSFFGTLEEAQKIADLAHARGALLIACVEPVSLGLLQAPAEYGADITCGEGQSLGIPLQYGGPWLGFIACKQALVRRMPGRICGVTKDNRGQRGFVLTLQTREQHIRREKATSNICTNQTLLALYATIYACALGPVGLKDVASQSAQKAHYLAAELAKIEGVTLSHDGPFFNEFAIKVPGSVENLLEEMRGEEILAGVPLKQFFPERDHEILVCVTETKSRADLDRYVKAVKAHV